MQREPDSMQLLAAAAAAIRAQAIAETQAKPQPTSSRLMTPAQAGEYISRSENAIRQLIFKRQIPVVRIGRNVRLDRRDLDALIDESKS